MLRVANSADGNLPRAKPAQESAYLPCWESGKVDSSAKSLTVYGEKVQGWMAAMTMDYKVDDPAILTKLKGGDQISATVYDGDYELHKVRVVPPSDSKSTR